LQHGSLESHVFEKKAADARAVDATTPERLMRKAGQVRDAWALTEAERASILVLSTDAACGA
jgi:hypothetical protein